MQVHVNGICIQMGFEIFATRREGDRLRIVINLSRYDQTDIRMSAADKRAIQF